MRTIDYIIPVNNDKVDLKILEEKINLIPINANYINNYIVVTNDNQVLNGLSKVQNIIKILIKSNNINDLIDAGFLASSSDYAIIINVDDSDFEEKINLLLKEIDKGYDYIRFSKAKRHGFNKIKDIFSAINRKIYNLYLKLFSKKLLAVNTYFQVYKKSIVNLMKSLKNRVSLIRNYDSIMFNNGNTIAFNKDSKVNKNAVCNKYLTLDYIKLGLFSALFVVFCLVSFLVLLKIFEAKNAITNFVVLFVLISIILIILCLSSIIRIYKDKYGFINKNKINISEIK